MRNIELQMQAMGLKGAGIFGGIAGMRAGASSLGIGSGQNQTLKALGDLTGKIAGVGQIVSGALGIAQAFGIGGPSVATQIKGADDATLREMAARGQTASGFGANVQRHYADLAGAELASRRTSGSQTVSGTVTTMTDVTGRNMLAEIGAMNSASQKYLPYLEEIAANTRAIASGGISAMTATRTRNAAGVG
jgi:hypothetical protein